MARGRLLNRVGQATATTGTGTVTLGAAVTKYATASEAGVANGDILSYFIEDGNDFEIGRGAYNTTGPTLARTTVLLSKIAGTAGTSLLNLSGAANVYLTALADDFAPDVQTFTTVGANTWIKPPRGTRTRIEVWGGGGSGSRHTTAANTSGGGGGGYNVRDIDTSLLGATETATVGAGGALVSGANNNGNNGSNSTFGGWLTGYGGAGGLQSITPTGGAGGGQLSAPAAAAIIPGLPFLSAYDGTNVVYHGHGGIGSVTPSGGVAGQGFFALNHGGGGGVAAPGGASVNGGGGGGASVGAGGTSLNGGAGGTGAGATGGAGTQPAGGGAGGTSASGKGGDGKIVITTW